MTAFNSARLFVVVLLAGSVGLSAEPVYTPPDQVGGGLTPVETLQHAKAYLDDHPTATWAPRAAFDLLLAASALKDDEKADRARAALLLDYPLSLQAQFVTQSFKDDEDFSKLMVQDFVRHNRALDRKYLHKFQAAASRAPEAARKNFPGDEKYAVAIILATEILQETKPEGDAKSRWKDRVSSKVLALVEAVTEERFGRQAQYLSLEQWPQNEVVQCIQRAYFERLQPRERSAEVYAVQLENLLFNGLAVEALALADSIPADRRSPRVRHRQALALAGGRKVDEAVALLKPAATDAADDPWIAGAAELRQRLQALPAALAEVPAAVKTALDDLRANPPTAFECTVEVDLPAGGPRQEGYLAYDSRRAIADVSLGRDSETYFRYRCEGYSGKVYISGMPKIRDYAVGRYLPNFRWSIGQSLSGRPVFKFATYFSSDVRDSLGDLIAPLREQPELFDDLSLRRLFHALIEDGKILAPLEERADERRVTLYRANRDSPKLSPLVIRLSRDGKIVGLEDGGFTVTHLRYGKSGDFDFAPRAWPNLPVEKLPVLKPSEMFQLYSAAMSALGG